MDSPVQPAAQHSGRAHCYTRNSSGDMGVGNYRLKSRLLPPLVLSKYSLNNRADRINNGHRLSKVDFETEVGLIIVLRRHCTWIRWNNAKGPLHRSRSFKVTDFDTNRLPVSDYTNLLRILHRFRDIAFDKSKIAIFSYPSCLICRRSMEQFPTLYHRNWYTGIAKN